MKRLLYFILGITILAAACKKKKVEPEPQLPFEAPTVSSDIPFLKVGNKWTYLWEDPINGNSSQTITIKEKIQNGVYLAESDHDGDVNDFYWYVDGDYLKWWASSEGGSTRYKLNAKVGDTWAYTNKANIVETEVLNTDTVIYSDELGKNFHTQMYYLTLKNHLNDQEDYWSPDTGLIYSDAWFFRLKLQSVEFK